MIHIASNNAGTKCDARDDGGLCTCVETFNVCGRITFSETETLCFTQRCGIVSTLVRHLRENEIGRAVHNPHHTRDRFTAQRFTQCTNKRYAASNGCFKQEVNAGSIGLRPEFMTHIGQEFFIRGNDRLAM